MIDRRGVAVPRLGERPPWGAVTLAAVALLTVACGRAVVVEMAKGIIQREWSPTAPACSLEDAGNSVGAGIVLYCAVPPAGVADAPIWLYTADGIYTVTDSAHVLTPGLRALSSAGVEAFRQAGLDRERFREQVADMIANQRGFGSR